MGNNPIQNQEMWIIGFLVFDRKTEKEFLSDKTKAMVRYLFKEEKPKPLIKPVQKTRDAIKIT